MKEKANFRSEEYYVNREISWLKFNRRVLEEARDKAIPLFERLKFLSITASNLDEFFMIRIASLKDMVHAGYDKPDYAGLSPMQQLELLNEQTHDFVSLQYSTYTRSLLPLLRQSRVKMVECHEDLSAVQGEYVDRFFEDQIYPVLTPMAVDSSRPFPLIRNKSLNIGALLHKKVDRNRKEDEEAKMAAKGKGAGADKASKKERKELEFATVQVPSVLPRIVALPATESGDREFVLLEEIIERNISKLFLNYDVVCSYPYRIMRNADLTIDEDEAADLLKEIEKQLKQRQWGQVIRLEVEAAMDAKLLEVLQKELDVRSEDVFRINGPLDLTFLMKLYGFDGFEEFKNPVYVPGAVSWDTPEQSLFEVIQQKDRLLCHPFESFDPVIRFVREAARDPKVLAIKQTLYRVSGQSPIIAALAQAAENGKQVTVLVELKARFDEENNIVWARMLEKAGCHVIYGLAKLKTHSKITLVVRREEDGIRRYVHLGTGNYNDATAKLYTDLGLLTCNPAIGEDATAVFNMLSGYSEPPSWNRLSLAPYWLKDRFLFLIRREKENALQGKQAWIRAKMNSLCDLDIMEALYEASTAGVTIDLIVRGICSLRVGIPGVSERISVRSIVGNFLEHSRVFVFCNDGREEIYLGSADWMPRNLERRVEILFPVEEVSLKEKIMHLMDLQQKDTIKAHLLNMDGEYERVDMRGQKAIDSQKICMEEAVDAVRSDKESKGRVFLPQKHEE